MRPSANAFFYVVALIAVAVLVAVPAQAQTAAGAPGTVTLANPASTNCVGKGGKISMETNGKGDQFGVCTFDDSRQCEEWALLRGECRVGGLKVTGYVTPASRYCAITGGSYKVKSASNTPAEKGTCTFKGGKSCDASAYFDGSCTRLAAPRSKQPSVAAAGIKATFRCSGGKTIDADFVNGANSYVKLVLSDGRTLDLPQARSGSGARYANAGNAIVFWNTGNTALIEERGKTTYAGCKTK